MILIIFSNNYWMFIKNNLATYFVIISKSTTISKDSHVIMMYINYNELTL